MFAQNLQSFPQERRLMAWVSIQRCGLMRDHEPFCRVDEVSSAEFSRYTACQLFVTVCDSGSLHLLNHRTLLKLVLFRRNLVIRGHLLEFLLLNGALGGQIGLVWILVAGELTAIKKLLLHVYVCAVLSVFSETWKEINNYVVCK